MIFKRTRIAVIICLLVVSIGLAVNIIFMSTDDRMTEDNTAEFTATVSGIKLNTVGKYTNVEITVNEYDTKLLIAHAERKIDSDKLELIHIGDAVHFRVQKQWIQETDVEALTQVEVVALRTNDTEIMSLGDYNASMDLQRTYAAAAGAAAVVLLLFICVRCLGKKSQKKESI